MRKVAYLVKPVIIPITINLNPQLRARTPRANPPKRVSALIVNLVKPYRHHHQPKLVPNLPSLIQNPRRAVQHVTQASCISAPFEVSLSAKLESSMNKESSSELPDNNNQYNKCINSSNINNNKKGSSEPNESSVTVKGPRLRQTRLRELNPETRDLCIHENIEPTGDPLVQRTAKDGLIRFAGHNIRGTPKLGEGMIPDEVEAIAEYGIDVMAMSESNRPCRNHYLRLPTQSTPPLQVITIVAINQGGLYCQSTAIPLAELQGNLATHWADSATSSYEARETREL